MTLPVQQPYLLPHQDHLFLLLKQLQSNPVNLGSFFLILQPPVSKSSQPNPVTLTSNPLLTLVYIFDWLIYEFRTPKTDLFFMKYRPISIFTAIFTVVPFVLVFSNRDLICWIINHGIRYLYCLLCQTAKQRMVRSTYLCPLVVVTQHLEGCRSSM